MEGGLSLALSQQQTSFHALGASEVVLNVLVHENQAKHKV